MAFPDVKKFVTSWRGVLAVLVFSVWALWCVPPWLVEQVLGEPVEPVELASLEDAYRRTLAQIFGGLALLYGLYLTQRRIVATEDNVRIAQEGQVTERFTRAIEQLGNDNLAIQLGGIYALERLAKDSEKDHGTIMEVLTAYVREKATKEGKYAEETSLKPTADIQAILTVLSRRATTNYYPLELDLNHTRLVGADLTGANLDDAYLTGADLTGAYLTGAYLNSADLTGADLTGANLTRARLDGAENLTAEQVLSAKNWHDAILPDYLQHLPHAHPVPPA